MFIIFSVSSLELHHSTAPKSFFTFPEKSYIASTITAYPTSFSKQEPTQTLHVFSFLAAMKLINIFFQTKIAPPSHLLPFSKLPPAPTLLPRIEAKLSGKSRPEEKPLLPSDAATNYQTITKTPPITTTKTSVVLLTLLPEPPPPKTH